MPICFKKIAIRFQAVHSAGSDKLNLKIFITRINLVYVGLLLHRCLVSAYGTHGFCHESWA